MSVNFENKIMITELGLLLILGIPYYFGKIRLRNALIIVLIFYWLPKCFVKRIAVGGIVLDGKHNKINQVSLTFDDMPYGNHKEIVTLLDKYNMKGTFFIISSYLTKETEDFFVDAVKQGHQLGNHGQWNKMHALLGYKQLEAEMVDCDQKIREIYNEH